MTATHIGDFMVVRQLWFLALLLTWSVSSATGADAELVNIYKKVEAGHEKLRGCISNLSGTITCWRCDIADVASARNNLLYRARFMVSGDSRRLDYLQDAEDDTVIATLLLTPAECVYFSRGRQGEPSRLTRYPLGEQNEVAWRVRTQLDIPLRYCVTFGRDPVLRLFQLAGAHVDDTSSPQMAVVATDSGDQKLTAWFDAQKSYGLRRIEQRRIDDGYETVASLDVRLQELPGTDAGCFAVARAVVRATQQVVGAEPGAAPLMSDCRVYEVSRLSTANLAPSLFTSESLVGATKQVLIDTVDTDGQHSIDHKQNGLPVSGLPSRVTPLAESRSDATERATYIIIANVLVLGMLAAAIFVKRMRRRR